MIRIGIVGDIGSGKSYVANNFGYPVFNADLEVSKLYKKDKKIYLKLKKKLPKYIYSFPINKNEIIKAILANKNNIKKIINIVHKEIRKKLKIFLNKHKDKKFVILDIPLLIESKIYNKKDILIFVDSKKKDINRKIKIRPNFNIKVLNMFRKIQLNPNYKKKKSNFIIKNDFKIISARKSVRVLKDKILNI